MGNGRRLFKQVFIAIIYLAIFTGIGIGIYFLVRSKPAPVPPPAPTIYPIETVWAQAFVSGTNLYSVGAKIRNPNLSFGSIFFTYTFYLYDANGNLLTTKANESFIWPGESKYLVEGAVTLPKAPVEVKLTIGEPSWREVKNFSGIDLSVGNVAYGKGAPSSGKYYTAGAVAANGTSYDLNKVYVSAIIFDKGNLPIAINSTVLENLKSKERRNFTIAWFSQFPGVPNSVDLNISTNLWDRPELIGQ